jgi:hypothetical protein
MEDRGLEDVLLDTEVALREEAGRDQDRFIREQTRRAGGASTQGHPDRP